MALVRLLNKFWKRRALVASGMVLFAFGVAVAPVAPADAATAAGYTPYEGMVDMLPSTVSASGLTGSDLASELYTAGGSDELWGARAAVAAGTADTRQIALVKQAASTFAEPATELGAVGTEVEGAGTAAAGGSGGVVGGGILAAVAGFHVGTGVASWMGLNTDGLCTSSTLGNTLVNQLTGKDCSDYMKLLDTFTPNADATAGLELSYCVNGSCATYLGGGIKVTTGYSNSGDGSVVKQYTEYPCFAWSESAADNPTVELRIEFNGNTPYAGSSENDGISNGDAGGACDAYPTANGYLPSNATGRNWAGTSSYVYTYNDSESDTETAYHDWESSFCGMGTGEALAAAGSCKGLPAANQPKAGSSDPMRDIKCTVTTTDGGTYSATSKGFKESDGVLPQYPNVTIPDGLTMQSEKCVIEGGTSDQTLQDQQTTPEFQQQSENMADTMDGSQPLTLRKNGVQCMPYGQGQDCNGWFADYSTGTSSNTYECRMGSHAVDMSECNTLAHQFDEGVTPGKDDLSDPTTGQQMENPNDTNPDDQPAGSTVQDPSNDRKCFPTGAAAWNPIAWVLTPVKCALEYEFVPRESVVDDDEGQIRDAINASGVGTIAADVSTIGKVNIAEGCQGIPLDFSMYTLHVSANLLSACPGQPLAAVAATTHTILTSLIITASVLACLRYVALIFGFSGLGSYVSGKAPVAAKRPEEKS